MLQDETASRSRAPQTKRDAVATHSTYEEGGYTYYQVHGEGPKEKECVVQKALSFGRGNWRIEYRDALRIIEEALAESASYVFVIEVRKELAGGTLIEARTLIHNRRRAWKIPARSGLNSS